MQEEGNSRHRHRPSRQRLGWPNVQLNEFALFDANHSTKPKRSLLGGRDRRFGVDFTVRAERAVLANAQRQAPHESLVEEAVNTIKIIAVGNAGGRPDPNREQRHLPIRS